MFEGTIASLTPTVCGLFGVEPPVLAEEPMLPSIRATLRATLGERLIERCLVYCPDAVGDHVWSRFPEHAGTVSLHCPQRARVSSVIPPKTPICFASVFTGASPTRHGIRKPERPVLMCDTLFDALIRAGKRIAIVAVQNSSIDLMYRRRSLDYFSEAYDAEVTARVEGLLDRDAHDLVVVYHQEVPRPTARDGALFGQLRSSAGEPRGHRRSACYCCQQRMGRSVSCRCRRARPRRSPGQRAWRW